MRGPISSVSSCTWLLVGAGLAALAGLAGCAGGEGAPGAWAPQQWSPDGARIAYTSDARDGTDLDVWLMDPDGTAKTRLTEGPSLEYAGAWSPDGSRLLISSNAPGPMSAYTMAPDGSDRVNVSNNATGTAWAGCWSPDGERIAYSLSPGDSSDVVVAQADGSGALAHGVPGANDSPYGWSSDGGRILFASNRAGGYRLYTMTPQGTGVAEVAPADVGSQEYGYWSPDGTHIAFASDRTGHRQVYVMGSDGSDVTQVTHAGGRVSLAGWSPDGSRLLVGVRDTDVALSQLWTVDADGSDGIQLTVGDADSW